MALRTETSPSGEVQIRSTHSPAQKSRSSKTESEQRFRNQKKSPRRKNHSHRKGAIGSTAGTQVEHGSDARSNTSDLTPADDTNTILYIKQPPVPEPQLIQEIKSVYAGLLLLETKCIQVDQQVALQYQGNERTITPVYWKALSEIHRKLLNEHVDMFLCSQHPSGGPALKRLIERYNIAARLWKHGIESYVELLRRALPESLDFLKSYLHLVYGILSMLLEIVPAFKATFQECLGDVARYFMASEKQDQQKKEVWIRTAGNW